MAELPTRLRASLDTNAAEHLERAFETIRDEFEVRRAFSDDVLSEATAAVANPELPERDETDVEFITIDPPGSMDLDQAMAIERTNEGEARFRVRYAIADVPAFVTAGGVVDDEVRLRGQTIYCPDTRVPLHPMVISEEAASLLPEATRPAYVWDIELGEDGRRIGASLYRAMVRSRRRYTYAEVQTQVDDCSAEESLMLLREVGRLRVARETARGGASLPMPEQEVDMEDGQYVLRFRPVLEAEEWNAHISLLTGMVAASMMIEGGVGILRTMPAADDRAVTRFRRQAMALGVEWPKNVSYGEFLRTLDRADSVHLAVIHSATALFRGAGYTPFNGEVPPDTVQSAIAAPYAHVTAPLRRLVDRFALAICAALSAGKAAPAWAVESLEELPNRMEDSGRIARSVDRACLDAVEAAVLEPRVGEVFKAVVVDETSGGNPVIQIKHPAITTYAQGPAELGSTISVELMSVDVTKRSVSFVVRDE